MITLALIEDDPAYRRFMTEVVARSGRCRLVGTFADAESALARLSRAPTDLAVVDIGLPGESGIDLVRRLHHRHPTMRCVILTSADDPETVFAALEAGACGYLLKSDTPAQIGAGLDELAAGGAPLSRAAAQTIFASFRRPPDPTRPMTDREREIMEALAGGLTYKEIAGRLGISAATVKNHLSRIYAKLDVGSRTEAVVKWLRRSPRDAADRELQLPRGMGAKMEPNGL